MQKSPSSFYCLRSVLNGVRGWSSSHWGQLSQGAKKNPLLTSEFLMARKRHISEIYQKKTWQKKVTRAKEEASPLLPPSFFAVINSQFSLGKVCFLVQFQLPKLAIRQRTLRKNVWYELSTFFEAGKSHYLSPRSAMWQKLLEQANFDFFLHLSIFAFSSFFQRMNKSLLLVFSVCSPLEKNFPVACQENW